MSVFRLEPCIPAIEVAASPRSPHFGIDVKPVGQLRRQHRRFFLREVKRFKGLRRQRFRQGP
ncbi:hypothetical protein KS23_24905 [Salmonella enterica]|nr:hypothetical protein [Salmonella enterica]EDV3997816.1 hypothetical protein [Salmonella enterica subsp. enterica serovar Mbandaka]EDV5215098.1 hypothetical protein [Salmonella enterica subsp. enterica]MBZ7438618.1 hypothetical protein [Klebsiella michiganensis]EBQ7151166.1 hypothetical protein [Salmonella enterica]